MPQAEPTEITLRAGEQVTLPSGDKIELHHTGKTSEAGQTTETAIVMVTPATS